MSPIRRTVNDLADNWTAEAARYRSYAEKSAIPGELRSIARTLEQCAAEVRAADAGAPKGSRVRHGKETSVQPDAIGPDIRPGPTMDLPKPITDSDDTEGSP